MNRSVSLKTVLVIAVLLLCCVLIVGYLLIDDVRGLLDRGSTTDSPAVVPGVGSVSLTPMAPLLEDDFSTEQPLAVLQSPENQSEFLHTEARGWMTVISDGVGLVTYLEPALKDFAAEVDIFAPDLSHASGAGLAFRVDEADLSRGYALTIGGPPTNQLILQGFLPDDVVTYEYDVPEGILPEKGPEDGFYRLRVEAEGASFRVFLNDRFVTEFTDPLIPEGGVLGLVVEAGESSETVEFDNLVVYANSGQASSEVGLSSDNPLRLGERREIFTEDVAPEGGTLVVDVPGDPLDGLTIEIPSGAYPDGTTVEVCVRSIEGHDFGPDFNPASPLIEIDAGEGLAEDFVTVIIPAQIATDEFGMAFAYEAEDGALEGMTHLGSDSDGVRFASRYLSRDLVVGTVKLDRLERDIETGFEHGVDDWQFRNYGTVLSPRGHCAGQSLAALYYFVEALGPPLYGQHDNFDHPFPDTPNLQWDDEEVWRLVSVVQKAIEWESASRKFWFAFADVVEDPGVYNAFAYSMLLTGQPQYVGIYGDKGGHALIVYGKREHSLLVSDPNYPIWSEGGRGDRTIDYSPGLDAFYPYYSGPSADNLGHPYDDIFYFGYHDLIDWQVLGELWADMEAGIVGDGHFPTYRLMVREGDSGFEEELWNNHEADSAEITVRIEAAFAPYLFAYDWEGTPIADGSDSIDLTLSQGDNVLGFLIATPINGVNQWVGFDWVKVIYEGEEETGSFDEISYEGTYSDSHGNSGEIEFYAYASGDVALKYGKTSASSGHLVTGTHENGVFEIPFSDSLSVTGTFSESSVSGSGSNDYVTWEFSGTRVD